MTNHLVTVYERDAKQSFFRHSVTISRISTRCRLCTRHCDQCFIIRPTKWNGREWRSSIEFGFFQGLKSMICKKLYKKRCFQKSSGHPTTPPILSLIKMFFQGPQAIETRVPSPDTMIHSFANKANGLLPLHTAQAASVPYLSSSWKPAPPSHYTHQAYPGEVKNVAIRVLTNVLLLLRIAKWKVSYINKDSFKRDKQLPYSQSIAYTDTKDELHDIIEEIFGASESAVFAKELVDRLMASHTVPSIISTLEDVDRLHTRGLQELGGTRFATFTPSHGDSATMGSGFAFALLSSPDRLEISWPGTWGDNYLHAVMKFTQTLRNEQRDPSFTDFVAFNFGYYKLSRGESLPQSEARFLGTVGFRKDYQTYPSLTDPGDGHIHGTTRKSRWMTGAIVHVEHLERPQNLPRDEIESYRIPSIFDFACVRMHTGNEAPNTYFVGRALRDSISRDFRHDFIKVVSITSAAASSAFALGAAECKVAMDGLTTKQMVEYMQALGGHALRKPRQYLSAAFNLNHPIDDDLNPNEDGTPRRLESIMDIGRRGVELAALGGFDKVTWDGASDKYPSEPIIVQLGARNALELVHLAHSVGLTTYMSAGFKFHNIKDAVYSGVDGIGIGGAQILRYMDGESGMHGPYTEENIDRIMVERNNAESSIRGRGVRLLARLDQMHFEGSLTDAEEKLREPLYQALYDRLEGEIYQILFDNKEAREVLGIPSDDEQPWIGRASRILRHSNPVLRKGAESEDQWENFVNSLRYLVDNRDEEAIYDMAQCEPWISMRRECRVALGEGHKVFKGEPRVRMKTTPYGGRGVARVTQALKSLSMHVPTTVVSTPGASQWSTVDSRGIIISQ